MNKFVFAVLALFAVVAFSSRACDSWSIVEEKNQEMLDIMNDMQKNARHISQYYSLCPRIHEYGDFLRTVGCVNGTAWLNYNLWCNGDAYCNNCPVTFKVYQTQDSAGSFTVLSAALLAVGAVLALFF